MKRLQCNPLFAEKYNVAIQSMVLLTFIQCSKPDKTLCNIVVLVWNKTFMMGTFLEVNVFWGFSGPLWLCWIPYLCNRVFHHPRNYISPVSYEHCHRNTFRPQHDLSIEYPCSMVAEGRYSGENSLIHISDCQDFGCFECI